MIVSPLLSPARYKRLAAATKHYVGFSVKSIKAGENGDVVIEGWANPATTDRETEVIPPEAWDIEEYEQNPIVLFNHGKDPNYGFLPVGKALVVKVADGGLWCKVVLSNSEVPKIKAVRDLVAEGILTTFSVGFDPSDEYQDNRGVNVVGHAKLLEISIVTLPMNTGAKFTLTSKDITAMTMSLKALRTKGAWVASAVQQRIYQLQQSHGDFNRDRALAEIGAQSGLRLDEVRNILAGEVTPVPTDALAAFAKVLGMDEGQLTKLDKGDRDVEKRQATAGGARQFGASLKGATLPPLRPDGPADWAEVMERGPKTDENVPPNKKDEPGPGATSSDGDERDTPPSERTRYESAVQEDSQSHGGDGDDPAEDPHDEKATSASSSSRGGDGEPPDTDPHDETRAKDDVPLGTGEPGDEPGDEKPTDGDDDSKPDVAVQAIVIPKEVVPSIQDATAWVKDHGWTVDDVNQSEEAFYFVQTDPSAFDPDSFYLVDIGNGAWAQVGARQDAEPYGTPPIDAQNEAKSQKDGEEAHNADKRPETQGEAPNAQTAPVPAAKEGEAPHNEDADEEKKQPAAPGRQAPPKPAAKDGASAGTAAGPAAGASPGDASTVPFAQPQGPGPWTSRKPPPKKKPTISVDPHTGQKRKGADPNADVPTGQPVDAEELDEHHQKVKAGTACAECMAKWMKDGLDNGKPHDQAVAIAISECKTTCPTQPQKDATGPVYSPDQLRAFADGFRTAHDQAKGAGIFKAGHKGGGTVARTKQGHMDNSPTSQIGAGGSQDPTSQMDDNPYILAAKQTNVLLGALIAEIQAMSKKLDGLVSEENEEQGPEDDQPPPPGAGQGSQMGMVPKSADGALANVRDYMRDLDGRLKKLGV